MKTAVNNTSWEVKFFPYKSFNPVTGDVEKTLQEDDPYVLKKGIVSISLSRSKSSPYGTASVTVVGRPDRPIQKGSWVIIYSKYGVLSNYSNDSRLPRFIGQVSSVSVNYVTNPNGNVRQTTNIVIREWSSILKTPVRLDATAAENNLKTLLPLVEEAAKKDSSFFTDQKFQEFVKNSIQPFDFVQVAFYFIGILNNLDNVKRNNPKLGNLPRFPKIALNMPAVHSKLLKELNFEVSDNRNAIASNFLTLLIGVQSKKPNIRNKFDGIFNESDFKNLKDSYTTSANRPYITNFSAVMSQGLSVYDLINQVGDSTLNELFTDINYVVEKEKIICKPTVYYRTKPTILKSDLEKYTQTTNFKFNYLFPFFDDLPEIKIDPVYIRQLSFLDTYENSPNYIYPDFQFSIKGRKAVSQLNIQKLSSEMYRYGGVSAFVPVQFNEGLVKNKDEKKQTEEKRDEENDNYMSKWLEDVKNFVAVSDGLSYTKPSLSITLKDNNIPISVGMNISFTLTDIKYVAHVESINVEHYIDGRGVLMTDTSLTCSNMVFYDEEKKGLYPLVGKMYADLFTRRSEAEEDISSADIFNDNSGFTLGSLKKGIF